MLAFPSPSRRPWSCLADGKLTQAAKQPAKRKSSIRCWAVGLEEHSRAMSKNRRRGRQVSHDVPRYLLCSVPQIASNAKATVDWAFEA